jgi:hypothetical protein
LGSLGETFDLTIAGGDARKAVVVNSGETGTEVGDAIPAGTNTENVFTMIQSLGKGADLGDANIAAGILTLGTDGNAFDLTGTETITGIASPTGTGRPWVLFRFDTARQLTHHATNLVLPGGEDILTEIGDIALFVEYAQADWRCVSYQRVAASGQIPQVSKSVAYTLVLSDAGKHILHPTADNSARTFTIPANASVAFPVGTVVTFVNQINTVTIAITTDTLQLAGSAATGSRTLAAGGMATAIKMTSTLWFISGTGLS